MGALDISGDADKSAPAADMTRIAARDDGLFTDGHSKQLLERFTEEWPKTDLLNTIIHELRAPLTVIYGQMQIACRYLLRRDLAGVDQALERAIWQTDRMSRLINELLDASGVASSEISLKMAPLDLAAVIGEAIDGYESGAARSVSFSPPSGSVRVSGDPDRIRQILENLLSNAAKYSGAATQIDVSLTIHGALAQVRVADSGHGITADERAGLFTPFYRTSSARDVSGTGLGLYISKALAERHGGHLRLETSSEAGSVFVLELPAAGDDSVVS